MAGKINYQIEMERELARIAWRDEISRRYEIINLHKRVPLVFPERSMEIIPVEEARDGGQNQPPD